MKRPRILGGREGGQAMVEFAVAGIVLFILILGTIDVGRAVWNYNTLAQATREGTRYAIVHGAMSSDPSGPGSSHYTDPNSDAMVTERIEDNAGGLDLSQLTVEADWVDGDNSVGSKVKVTSRYTYEPVADFLGVISFDMSNSSTMEITH